MACAKELGMISGGIRKENAMGMTFWDTVAGYEFVTVTVPKLIKEIRRLNENLEQLNDTAGKSKEAKEE